MKIYAVQSGNDYEGPNISTPLFKIREDALMEASARASLYNDNNGDLYKLLPDGETWRDGNYYIRVVEYELI